MSTWVLVLTIMWNQLVPPVKEISVAMDHISGFKSKADCDRAAETMRATNSLLQAVCIEQSK